MSRARSSNEEPSPMVRRFATDLVESYLDADVGSSETVERVEELYANDELLAAVNLIATTSSRR